MATHPADHESWPYNTTMHRCAADRCNGIYCADTEPLIGNRVQYWPRLGPPLCPRPRSGPGVWPTTASRLIVFGM